ncbi:MAG: helix-turn-helix transcriptional regulator [Verrucomicrobia bacterium]|nr:helix-turn-helix transcriptional regulator [Verrucomicrobiota bacterium]
MTIKQENISSFSVPARLLPVQKQKLPRVELDICRRLHDARKKLGLTAADCAHQIGVPRTTLVNYEMGKTPIRADVALQFCREFLVSEEWLATGRYDALKRLAAQKGIPETSDLEQMPELFFRQCVDLHSEVGNRGLPSRSLYSEAFPNCLAPIYERLAGEFFYFPRVVLCDNDNPQILQRFIQVTLARWLLLLGNEAVRRKFVPGRVRREYIRALFEVADLIFLRFMGQPTPGVQMPHLEWLRVLVRDPNVPLGTMQTQIASADHFLADTVSAPAQAASGKRDKAENIGENNLKEKSLKSTKLRVTPDLASLLERLNQATAARGQKMALAQTLGVPPARVSEWLSGKKEPGGAVTLRLLDWVEEWERQQQESPGRSNRPEPEAQRKRQTK